MRQLLGTTARVKLNKTKTRCTYRVLGYAPGQLQAADGDAERRERSPRVRDHLAVRRYLGEEPEGGQPVLFQHRRHRRGTAEGERDSRTALNYVMRIVRLSYSSRSLHDALSLHEVAKYWGSEGGGGGGGGSLL